MGGERMTGVPDTDCPHTLDAASFLLGAHDDPDSFRRHAAGCPTCQAELTRLQPVSEALAGSAPEVAAPRELRRRVFERVSAEADILGAAGPEADRPPSLARSRPRWAGALAAAAVLAVLGIAIALSDSSGGGGVRTTVARPAASVAGAVAVLRQSGGHAELLVAHMPQAPAGKVYEVWLKPPGSPPRPTDALFSVTSQGRGSVDVPAALGRISEVLVTSEPVGGSAHPTGPALLTFRLA
jgi:anti-sigma-K factor RskA